MNRTFFRFVTLASLASLPLALPYEATAAKTSHAKLTTVSLKGDPSCGHYSIEAPFSKDNDLESGVRERVDGFIKAHQAKWGKIPLPALNAAHSTLVFSPSVWSNYCRERGSSNNFDFQMTTKLFDKTSSIISAKVEATYSSMTSPFVAGTFINYNTSTGKFIDDLSFLKPSAQVRVIKAVHNRLQKLFGGDLLEDEFHNIMKVNKGKSHFGFEDDHLVFTFWMYEVGPRAHSGVPITVRISDDDWI